jgi:hypothetical protein
MVDREDRERIQALEQLAVQRDREVAALSSTVSRLTATVEAIRASLRRSSPPTLLRARSAPSAPPIEKHRTEIWALKAPRYGFASLIVADLPALFAEFHGRRFALLWRGSPMASARGPFTAAARTLWGTFLGFTPVEWESRIGNWAECFRADLSLNSFLRSLKNPHNLSVRKFALNAERRTKRFIVIPRWVQSFVALGFPITASQTPAVPVPWIQNFIALGLIQKTQLHYPIK